MIFKIKNILETNLNLVVSPKKKNPSYSFQSLITSHAHPLTNISYTYRHVCVCVYIYI